MRSTVALQFPDAWAQLPTNGRYLTLLAARAGVQIDHDGQDWVWRAPQAQLEASGLFNASTNWNFQRRQWITTAEGVRADACRGRPGGPIEMRVAFWSCESWGRPRCGRRVLERATIDPGWPAFRARMLAPVEGVKS